MISKLTYSQLTNLIPNGSFEDCTKVGDPISCPDSSRYNLNSWYKATDGNFKYFNGLSLCDSTTNGQLIFGVPASNIGYQWAKDGIAYCGLEVYYDSTFYVGYYSYLQIILDDTLVANHVYCFSLHLSLIDCCTLSTSSFGALFTDSAIHRNDGYCINYYTPQIQNRPEIIFNKEDWTLVSGTFISNGNELYLTVGNFKNIIATPIFNAEESDYDCNVLFNKDIAVYIDDISLYDCTGFYYEAEAGENRELCKGEETTLGWDENTTRTFKWSVVSGDSASLSNDSLPRPTVSPQQTTVYALYVVDEYVQEHFDTVTVVVVNCGDPIYLPNIFSPNNDGNNDVFYVRSSYVKELKSMRIYDRWGEEVFNCSCFDYAQHDNCCGWDGKYHGQDAPIGVYAVFVEALLMNGETIIKRGNVTLVR